MWNIRMRASKSVRAHVNENEEIKELHISGAEGIFDKNDIGKALNYYLKRAMGHSRGSPDKIIFTIEKVNSDLLKIPALAVTTLECFSPEQARRLITEQLLELGITKVSIKEGFNILDAYTPMRGAALVRMLSGCRADPDKLRGVRASRLGIEKEFNRKLNMMLAKLGINTERVKEALVLASKVAYHEDIVAELCISDNPEYTTGYIASKKYGYVRIPNIKCCGDMSGGRVFFIREDANISSLIKYLEKTPVIISGKK